MRVARVWRTSVLAVAVLLAGQLAPLSAAHAAPPFPYALVDSPGPGAIETGMTTITGEGHADPGGTDQVFSLQLVIDTVPQLPLVDCTTGQASAFDCAGSFSFDFSALPPGQHSVVVELTTAALVIADSPTVEVTVPTIAAPTVVINTPHPASPATGVVSITATGTVDVNDSDSPGSLQARVDSTLVGSKVPCPAASQTCALSLPIDTTAFRDGSHSISAVFLTTGGTKKTSTGFSLTFSNPPPVVAISSPASGATVSGNVTVTASGSTTAAEDDSITSMKLFVSGTAAAVDTQSCSGNTCNASFNWNATGLGDVNRTLKVELFTTKHPGGTIADSVAVHVRNPVPGVAISSPAPGASVFGTVVVNVTGTVDAAQSDTAKSMALFINAATTPVDSVTCSGHSCSGPLTWDASAVTGPATLTVKLTTANNKTGMSSVNVTVVSQPPFSSVTSPATGSTVSGVVAVMTTGGTSPTQNDAPQTIQLVIDGAAFGAGPAACTAPAGQHTCSVPYIWDTTGMSGVHTLQTRFVTRLGIVVLGPITTVTVVSPGPTAVITSPGDSATVHRDATITVAGAVDPTQTDAPASMKVTVDGKQLGSVLPCVSVPTAPRTCSATFPWSTLGLTGKHVLVATFTTVNGAVGVSAATAAYVYGGTTIGLPKIPTLRAGKAITIKGRVTALINKTGAAGVRVKILVVPSNGKQSSFFVTTDANGYYKIPFKPSMNTVVEATVAPPAYYGVSHTYTKLAVIPQPSCTLKTKLARNTQGKGLCKLLGMPKGTKLKLQYEVKGKWYTLGTGRAPGTKVPFVYGFKVAGVYHVRLVFAASHVFVATTGPSLKVVVT